MIAEIKCPSCQTILGYLEKENVNTDDVAEYVSGLRCKCEQPVELIIAE